MQWTFDNSADHPHHGTRAPTPVVAGNRTTDEMAHLQIQVRVRNATDRLLLEEAYFRHLLRRDSQNAKFLYGLATALKDMERWEEAAATYRAAHGRNPDYVLAHYYLRAVLMQQGHASDAIR